MKTLKIFITLVVFLCIAMYALVDFSNLFLLPILWLFWLMDLLGIQGLVGGESFGTFPTFFGFFIMILGASLSLFLIFIIAKFISKKGIKNKK